MKLDDDTLQRYFDGDLPSAEAATVGAHVAGSAQDRARLTSLESLHELIVAATDTAGEGVAADALFDRVRSRLHDAPGLRVVGEAGTTERWRIWVPVASGFAIAAVVLLVLLREPPTGPTATARTTEVEPTTVTQIEAPLGSEIERVDFGSSTGTVFEVEGAAGEPIAVVWINDEPLEVPQ